ncbi:MAG: 16S rRNA (cytosine(1402)-N(4))-methyltransferase RsmH [Planctomycetota bacterium]|nr:MAG: 16S rRNA (cytosine(1402)-N(4))-methyltransferase RsmH [Planctomycetota bacterium]
MPRPLRPSGPSRHEPVLLREVVELLAPERGGLFLDATVGGGGHAAALLDASPEVRLLAVDRDAEALARARERLAPWADRVEFRHAPFSAVPELLPPEWRGHLAGVLADFGVSSDQLEDPDRGFSFLKDGPLDMRMDATLQKTSAAKLLATASEDEIEAWLRDYGEERYARRIAHGLVEARRRGPLLRTSQLTDLVSRIVPRAPRGVHPATRTFQALRIAVNRELDEIDALLRAVPPLLAPGGVFAAISFHSLEDRRVKLSFRNEVRSGAFEDLSRGCIRPGPEELRRNPRARSSRLRAVRRHEGKE